MNKIIEQQREIFNKGYEEIYFNRWKRFRYYRVMKEMELKTILRKNFNKIGDLKCLELGCGLGLSTNVFNKITRETIGLDISDKSINMAKVFNPNCHFIIGSCDDLKFKENNFDAIFSFVTFHHLSDEIKKRTFRECYRVLKENGSIVIIEPNVESKLVQLVLKLFGKSKDKKDDLIPMKEMRETIHKSGFKSGKGFYFGAIPYLLRFLYSDGLNKLFSKVLSKFCGYYIISAKKEEITKTDRSYKI